MRFVGVDIAAERHVFAILAEDGAVLARPTPFGEDAEGYAKLLQALAQGPALVVMEATGHTGRTCSPSWSRPTTRWRCSTRSAAGVSRTRTCHAPGPTPSTRSASPGSPERNAPHRPGSARPPPKSQGAGPPPRPAQAGLRRPVRQLHRLVDLGFPEFTRYVRALDSQLATVILADYPTAQALAVAAPHHLAKLRYDGRHKVGCELARQLVEAARRSVGQHHGRRTGSRSATSARTSSSGASA